MERKELLNAKRICNKSHWFYKLQLVFNLFPFFILGALQQNPILNTFSFPSPFPLLSLQKKCQYFIWIFNFAP